MQAVQIDMDRSPSLWTHFKRQRKTPPASVTSEDAVDEPCAIDESNIGNQILNRMGWTPGTRNNTKLAFFKFFFFSKFGFQSIQEPVSALEGKE